ncbi:unnamed protein product [Effrenium voratum]|nr:unnamed protein product [Effrenium voratum]
MVAAVCKSCDTQLDQQRWAQVNVPGCQHVYHLSCMLKEAKGKAFSCAECEALAGGPTGLRMLQSQCSEEVKRWDVTDLEFWRACEIKTGAEMIPHQAVPSCILAITGLRCLDFTGHPLTQLPKMNGSLKCLSRLVVVSASLAELPEEICELTNLKQLYAKLQPASQLKRRRGLAPCPATLTHQEVLVVAFAASQAEPEWLGVLSQVYSGQVSIAEAEAQISMDCLGGFSELMRRLHGEGTEKLNEKLASTAWLLGPPHLSGQNGAVLGDFDVLSLCDTGAQWYCDVAEREQLQLESKLREFVKNYRRVIFLGVSMGGFAALSNSHLANSVLVFGPQTDLTLSHLRPGFSPDDLQRHSENMRCRVREAVAAGVQFQYHVAVEEHLAYARRVPLPLSSIFIHPIEGRIARLMEKTGILWPLLVRSIAREQKLARGEKDKWPKAEDKPPSGFFAWDLDGKEEVLQLCLWGAAGKLSTCKISGQNLTLLSKSGPRANDWFCSGCLAHNVSKASSCKKCGDSGPPQGVVAKAWRKHVPEEPLPSSRASVLARIRRLPWRTLGLVLVLLWLALRRRLR